MHCHCSIWHNHTNYQSNFVNGCTYLWLRNVICDGFSSLNYWRWPGPTAERWTSGHVSVHLLSGQLVWMPEGGWSVQWLLSLKGDVFYDFVCLGTYCEGCQLGWRSVALERQKCIWQYNFIPLNQEVRNRIGYRYSKAVNSRTFGIRR